MSEEKIRCFISVDIDNHTVLDNLYELQKALKKAGADIKLVDVNNLHLTLKFLGDIVYSIVKEVCGVIDDVVFHPFDIELKKVGVFPSMKRISVVWVSIEKGNSELLNIFNQLESKLYQIGFQPEKRKFVTHITVARVRSRRNRKALVQILGDVKNREFGVIRVSAIKLKKSVLTPKGPIYSTIHEATAKHQKT